jgi:L-Ala-D/L-Glu epimerase
MLERIDLYRLELPLSTPYHLSFGDVHHFDTVLVRLVDGEGREGLGDATVLTGYTDETIDGTWQLACELANRLGGSSVPDLRAAMAPLVARAPFLASAFASAADMLEGAAVLRPPRDRLVPVLGTINDTEPAAMRAQIDRLCQQGYRTLKIKVGTDHAADAVRIRGALEHVAGRALLRVDANQGFSPPDAIAFAHAVPREGIELFEQPCKAGDWESHLKVAANCPLPLMLDESIYDEVDIDRAAATGSARFVKVKLMKFISLDRLARAIERIRFHEIEPVLGNGVASDIGCWQEACVAEAGIRNAGEMNGWLKMRRSILRNPLRIEAGAIRLPAGWWPQLDDQALDACTVARHRAHPAAATAPVHSAR